eukprot:g908.t1
MHPVVGAQIGQRVISQYCMAEEETAPNPLSGLEEANPLKALHDLTQLWWVWALVALLWVGVFFGMWFFGLNPVEAKQEASTKRQGKKDKHKQR